MADNERLLARERLQIEQIRALDLEELEVEEVDDDYDDSSADDAPATGRGMADEYTFNTCLASLHTYLGEVEDTHHRMAFLDGGAVLNLPIFYLEGVVLFPDATLPLRVIQPNFIVAIERALNQVDAPYTIGVIRVYRDPDNRSIKFANVGTTAEIRQFRRLEDGSLNVVTRGQQRFRLRRRWIDVEGAPYGEIQIIQEDVPLRAPRAAFGDLAPFSHRKGHNFPRAMPSHTSRRNSNGSMDVDNDSEPNSDESFESALSLTEREINRSAIQTSYGSDVMDESTSSDGEKSEFQSQGSQSKDSDSTDSLHSCPESLVDVGTSSISEMQSSKQKDSSICWRNTDSKQIRRVPRAFWPYWVYRMYDSYCLAQEAADMWKQIVGAPLMDCLVKKPDLLSFYIASKIPVSESTRQELLEIDGISYRLRREIELLQTVNLIRCKTCQTVFARRSDMLVMSSEGPLGAYVNPHGCVHEIMTLHKATGLALIGSAVKEYSWFPGYAWTITNCATCETQMGWLFTATKKNLKPRLFWGIRSSQVSDDLH
ncbi:PREDICTED: protein cereblon [Fragaria vesca subsp. vesca]|uniref:protein cereblon n=1 Tax=Fragaria vesca subsp. vesca TaxID=101020 RepID=UPI0002C3465C|nr:PREDICTED: protein cereblon [Fragaria vesca subsp. vesca]